MPGLLLLVDRLQQLRDGQRLKIRFRLDKNGPIGTERQAGTQLLLAGRLTHRNSDHFLGDARLFQPYRFLDADLAKRVHRHLDVGEVDAGAVRLHSHLDVGVHDALDRNHDLHARCLPIAVAPKEHGL